MEEKSRSLIGIDDFYWLAVPLWEIEEKALESNSECAYADEGQGVFFCLTAIINRYKLKAV
jgi:hypothetical protein